MKQKIKVLFICHGNICRSPMAEFVMKDMAAKAGLAERFEIASAATSTGGDRQPGLPACAAQAGRAWHRLRGQNCPPDDAAGLRALRPCSSPWTAATCATCSGLWAATHAGKVSLLMDHTARPGDVADPWYTGDFDATWRDVTEGCAALLEELKNKI